MRMGQVYHTFHEFIGLTRFDASVNSHIDCQSMVLSIDRNYYNVCRGLSQASTVDLNIEQSSSAK